MPKSSAERKSSVGKSAASGVRVSKAAAGASGAAGQALRRRPRQSRAQASSEALQGAFVQVLIANGFARTTVREVADVAGVAVGTFYEYFGNMRALAALCIHRAISQAGVEASRTIDRFRGQPLETLVDALLDNQIRVVSAQPQTWAALYLLERQISSPGAFNEHYAEWVELWKQAIAASRGPSLSEPQRDSIARMIHAMTYGWISQNLLTIGAEVDFDWLREQLGTAVHGYCRQCLGVAADR